MHFEFDMSMTWRETWYFLFAKKICPKCNGALDRKISTSDEGWDWITDRDGLNFRVDYGHTTQTNVTYGCRNCRLWYPISILAVKDAA